MVAGLKPDGLAVINTGKKPSELGLKTKARVVTVPGSADCQADYGPRR